MREEGGNVAGHLSIGLCAALLQKALEAIIALEGEGIDTFFYLTQRPDSLQFVAKHAPGAIEEHAEAYYKHHENGGQNSFFHLCHVIKNLV